MKSSAPLKDNSVRNYQSVNSESFDDSLDTPSNYSYTRTLIYSGIDAAATTLATIAIIVGAKLDPNIVVVVGIAHLITDGLSMSIGDILSWTSQYTLFQSECKNQEWEFYNNMEDRVEKLAEIYEGKSLSKQDAKNIAITLAKYPNVFIKVLLQGEL